MITLIASGPQDYAALKGAQVWRGYKVPDGGVEPDFVLDMLKSWSARLLAAQGWGTWLAVCGDEVVGSIAVKNPVAGGQVEIGYGKAPARRGRGHATGAVQVVLLELARHGVVQVVAETAIDNPASGRVLQKAGFEQVGSRVDAEDGDLILWARELG